MKSDTLTMVAAFEAVKARDQKSPSPARASASPSASVAQNPILACQRQAGNQAVQSLLKRAGVQAKLAVSQPNDPEEVEADQAADHVMRMPNPHISSIGIPPALHRKCAACEEEEQQLSRQSQAKPATGAAMAAPPIVHEVLGSSGRPLDTASRSFFEPRFGCDFEDVRVHTDARADASASSVNALAYTAGRNIVFGAGQYQPATAGGQRLIAHELAHVVQQGGSARKDAQGSRVSANVKQVDPSSTRLQRMGDPKQRPASLTCPMPTNSSGSPMLTSIMFNNESAALTPAAIAELGAIASEWNAVPLAKPRLRVDGYASTVGAQSLNWTLSCNRALAVVTELETPSSGAPGIPAGFFDMFAQGATDEFDPDEHTNRRVTIRGSLAVPPIPAGGCVHPGDSRTLDVQPVFLRTDPADHAPTGASWPRRFSEANRIWGKLGVVFNELTPVTIDTPLKTTGSTDAERDAIRALRSGPGIEVFLVDDPVGDQGGAYTVYGCGPDGKVVMTDQGSSDTLLAHELGHSLGIRHPKDAFNPGDPNSIMQATDSPSVPNLSRNTMINFHAILCPAGTGTTCLNPDP